MTFGLAAVGLYLLAGLVLGVPFVLRGVDRLDPAARGGSTGFRLAILPGVIALWPWIVFRGRDGGAAA